jgi:hypothetical protein
LDIRKASKVDAGIDNVPGQERVTRRSTLVKNEAVAAAYLRAAQAYMLISMPTGTSTIFGVFQAILALLVKPDELRPAYKVIRIEKFASEIFFCRSSAVYAALQQQFTGLCGRASNQ